jgi:hypothetical protein
METIAYLVTCDDDPGNDHVVITTEDIHYTVIKKYLKQRFSMRDDEIQEDLHIKNLNPNTTNSFILWKWQMWYHSGTFRRVNILA